MTRLSVTDPSHPLATDADAVVVPVGPGWDDAPLTAAFAAPLADRLRALAEHPARTPALALPLGGGKGPHWVVCVGVEPGLPPAVAHRHAGMRAAAALGQAQSVAVAAEPANTAAVGEGILIGRYRQGDDLGAPEAASPGADTPPSAETPPGAPSSPLARATILGRAVNWCRALVDHPSTVLTPQRLAEVAVAMAEAQGIESRVWSEDDLRAERFGGILGVAQGGEHPPCMVDLRIGEGRGPKLVFVGKGVTCDTGGLQLKTEAHEWLRADMAGAGAILAAAWAVAALDLEVDLRVLLPCVENMPGPGAYRTGDVVTHRDGTTSEVSHTDVEGRMVLADVLSYAAESQPDAIVDLATLTDGGALGPALWGVLGNDDRLAQALVQAGAEAGDPGWQLPLWRGYRPLLHSQRADRGTIAHLGAIGVAGTIVGGVYLSDFVGDVPWAHIDVAGACFHAHGFAPWPPGATGAGTAALVRFTEAHQ